jgi:hypothetical protein
LNWTDGSQILSTNLSVRSLAHYRAVPDGHKLKSIEADLTDLHSLLSAIEGRWTERPASIETDLAALRVSIDSDISALRTSLQALHDEELESVH